MKKLFQDNLNKHALIGKKKSLKSLKRKGKVYGRFKPPLIDKVVNLSNYKIINAPEKVSIYDAEKPTKESYIETLKFREDLSKYLNKKDCVIDFSTTMNITAAAMLVIFSEIQTLVETGSSNTIIGWSKVSPSVNRMLKRTGLKKLLRKKDSVHNFSGLRNLPIISGTGSQHYDDIVDFIITRYFHDSASPDTEYLISDAVSEAINNVSRHAYPDLDVEDKRWWLTCDVIGNQLYLAIYDRGIGIPHTVVEKRWFWSSLKATYPEIHDELKEKLGEKSSVVEIFKLTKYKDAELIYLSMIGDISGTQKSKHGQGSKSFKALVNNTDGGRLWVYSNKGLYIFENDDAPPQVYKLPKDIGGTLNQWNISLK